MNEIREITMWHAVLAVAMIINAVVSVAIILRGRKSKSAVFLGIMLFFAMLWGLEQLLFDIYYPSSIFTTNYSFAAAAILAYFFVLFAMYFPNEKSKDFGVLTQLLLALPAALMVAYAVIGDYFVAGSVVEKGDLVLLFGPLYTLFNLIFLAYVFFGFALLIVEWKKARRTHQALKFLLITGGLLIGFGIGILFNMIWGYVFGTATYHHVGPTGILVVLAFLSWTILRHRLFEIDVQVSRKTISTFLVSVTFIAGFILYSFVLTLIQGNLIYLTLAALVFGLSFLRIQSFVSYLMEKHVFNAYVDNVGDPVSKEAHLGQLSQLQKELSSFFGKTLDDVGVDLYYLNDSRNKFVSLSGDKSLLLSQGDFFTRFIMATRGVVFAHRLDSRLFRDSSEEKLVRHRMGQLQARAFVTMRHWTNELVIIAFIRCNAITDEQEKSMQMRMEFDKPKWDEIASKIYTNKRAVESLTRKQA